MDVMVYNCCSGTLSCTEPPMPVDDGIPMPDAEVQARVQLVADLHTLSKWLLDQSHQVCCLGRAGCASEG